MVRVGNTGTPVEITLGGRVYYFSPQSLGDMEEFQTWAEMNCVALAKARAKEVITELGNDATQADRARIKESFIRGAYDLVDSGRATVLAMRAKGGIARMLLSSLRYRHPELTLEMVTQLVDMAGVDAAQAALDKANGYEALESEDSKSNPPNPPLATENPASAAKTGEGSSGT